MDGKEIYNTIRRKRKDAFYKNIVKKGNLQFNKGNLFEYIIAHKHLILISSLQCVDQGKATFLFIFLQIDLYL